MYGGQLVNIIEQDPIMNSTFRGLLSRDGTPVFSKKSASSFVLNSQPAGSLEGHWVLVYKKRNGPLIFFDPLGQSPGEYSNKWLGWMKKSSARIIRNTRPVQPPQSALCGCYCLFVLFKLSHQCSFKNAMSHFSSIRFHNDTMIAGFMRSQFHFDVTTRLSPPPQSNLQNFALLLSKDYV